MRQNVAAPFGVQHIVWYKYNTPHLAATKCRSPFGAQHIVYNYKLYAGYSRCDKMSQHFFARLRRAHAVGPRMDLKRDKTAHPHPPFFKRGPKTFPFIH